MKRRWKQIFLDIIIAKTGPYREIHIGNSSFLIPRFFNYGLNSTNISHSFYVYFRFIIMKLLTINMCQGPYWLTLNLAQWTQCEAGLMETYFVRTIMFLANPEQETIGPRAITPKVIYQISKVHTILPNTMKEMCS